MQDKIGSTALMRAALYGREGVCDLLITRGCKLDMQSEDGDTALMKAARNGHIPTVIYLIEAGCDHSLRNKKGKSALDFVKEKDSDKVKEVQAAIDTAAAVLQKKEEDWRRLVNENREDIDINIINNKLYYMILNLYLNNQIMISYA